ncbi:DbpA RNA binding domain-containing protein [Microbulbifer sp. SH-1]|uniref:DbpA RNA binding domain-containing protein n=1 Tax=Microbulbifer sp. SH-1 TaxID=2681547 RepID=UPI00352FFC3A
MESNFCIWERVRTVRGRGKGWRYSSHQSLLRHIFRTIDALTGEGGINGNQIGKIQIFDFSTFVAVERPVAKVALNKLGRGKIKGRNFRARIVGV